MDAKELSLVFISFAMITGDNRSTVCDRHRLGRDQEHEYEHTEYSKHTIALPLFHGPAFVYIDQLHPLVLHENACYEWRDTICLNPP